MSITTKRLLAGLFVVMALQFSPQMATAQFGGDRIQRPLNRPTVSPYLNLFRRGSSGGNSILNYYGMVRPQNQALQRNRQLDSNLRDFERDVNSSSSGDNRRSLRRPMHLGTTGHRTSFMTLGGGGGQRGGGGGGSGDDGQNSGFSGHSAGFGNGPGFGGASGGSFFGSDQ